MNGYPVTIDTTGTRRATVLDLEGVELNEKKETMEKLGTKVHSLIALVKVVLVS